MKRIIALLVSGILLVSCCFLSVSAADNAHLDSKFAEYFNSLEWMYYGLDGTDFFYSLSEGPKAEFVNEYLLHSRVLEQYIGAQNPEGFIVSEQNYEKLAFTYFEKTDKLLDLLHSLDIYTTDGYKSYEGGWGDPSVGFKYIKNKALTNERYEVFCYIYWQYAESPDDNIIETEYTPSANEIKDKDYIVFHNNSNTDVYAKIIGGIKSTVYFDGINPPKYLSIEKLPKDDFLNILNVIDNPVSSAPSGSDDTSTPSDTGSSSEPASSSSSSSASGENATSSGNTTTSSDSSVSSEKPTSSENNNTSGNNSGAANGNISSASENSASWEGNSNSSENPSSDKNPYVSTNTSQNENGKPDSSSVTSVNSSIPSSSGDTDLENSSTASSGDNGTVSSDRTDSATNSDKTNNNDAVTNATVIIVIISAAVVLIGGGSTAYYFLIVKPKMPLNYETFVIPESTEVDGDIESEENTNP